MKQVSVRSVVSVSTLTIAVNVWIQSSTVNSEPIASFGRCQETGGRKKLMKFSAVGGMGYRQEIRRRLGYFNGFDNRETSDLLSLRGGLYSHLVENVVHDL